MVRGSVGLSLDRPEPMRMCGLILWGSGATTIRDMTGELLHPRQLSTKRSHVANVLYPPRATRRSADTPKRYKQATSMTTVDWEGDGRIREEFESLGGS